MPSLRPLHGLLEAFRALPAAAPLLPRLSELDGVHLVGGAVRDLLLGGNPLDLDFVVEGEVAPVAGRLGGAIVVHDRFGTSTVTLGGRSYDFARARSETYAHPGALPAVTPAGIGEDLRRRDFTVNAIALAVAGPRAGRADSVPGALEDLEAGVLRSLHDESFEDDPTRILRLARYRARLRFGVEPRTGQLLRAALDSGALKTVSGNRLGAELRLAAAERDPLGALGVLTELGVAAALEPGFGLADPAVAREALSLLPEDGDAAALTLACCCLGIDLSRLGPLLDHLAFPAHQRGAIVTAAHGAPALARALESSRLPSEIDAAAAGRPPEAVALAGALGPASQAHEWLSSLRHVRLEIGGDDLLREGVAPGPAVGAALRAARQAKLDGRASGREAELVAALEAVT